MENQINLSWCIKAESAQCEWRGAEVCANSIKPCCAMKGHFVWCQRRKTFVYQSSSASGLALNVIFPPTARPTPPSFDLTSSVFSCPRRLAHNEIRRSPVVCYTQSHSSANIDNTRLTGDPKKSLPSGQKHDSISLSISAPRTKNIFRSVGVGGFCGTKCLLEHLVKKKKYTTEEMTLN